MPCRPIQWLYHIATVPDWDQARRDGEYRTSTRGRTLSQEGFIHASTADQVLPVAALVYRDEPEDLVLLMLDPGRIGAGIQQRAGTGLGGSLPAHLRAAGRGGGGPGGAARARRGRWFPLAGWAGPAVTGTPPGRTPPGRTPAGDTLPAGTPRGDTIPAGTPRGGRPPGGAGVLYVIACAAPPAAEVGRLVSLARRRGWDVCVLTTPSARRFTDTGALERQTGHPVRSEYKNPGEPDVLPDPDAIIVAPATVNTINKWAAGICDTLALGILVEAIGKRLPIVALPSTNQAHAAHPAFTENIGKLRSWGVSVLFGADVHPLAAPGAGDGDGDGDQATFPWSATLDALQDRIRPAAGD